MLYPYLLDLLVAVGYSLMLPVVAVLHVQHRRVRDSGAILGTIAGTTVVAVGMVASLNVDLHPAALFVLGIWWWTIGKMWSETGLLGGHLGQITAALGALALAGAFVESASVLSAVLPGFPEVDVWTLMRISLGAWLLVLALALPHAERSTT